MDESTGHFFFFLPENILEQGLTLMYYFIFFAFILISHACNNGVISYTVYRKLTSDKLFCKGSICYVNLSFVGEIVCLRLTLYLMYNIRGYRTHHKVMVTRTKETNYWAVADQSYFSGLRIRQAKILQTSTE